MHADAGPQIPGGGGPRREVNTRIRRGRSCDRPVDAYEPAAYILTCVYARLKHCVFITFGCRALVNSRGRLGRGA